MKLTFLGGAGTVTGSKALLQHGRRAVLVDCGLFQGFKVLRERNRAPLPFKPADLDAVVLTHAHLDHSGYLPLLVRNGFRGPVHCTSGTADLCAILLPDSGAIQEEDAARANRRGYSRHSPAEPLYTRNDADACLGQFVRHEFGAPVRLFQGMDVTFSPAGHILGAASALVTGGGTSILFSGDLGRPKDDILKAPAPPPQADYLVVESTYGDRAHPHDDPVAALGQAIARATARGGIVMIASFAVGRAQSLLWAIHCLKRDGRIPASLPVYLNSPMARDVTRLYRDHRREHRLSKADSEAMCAAATVINTVEDSKALNRRKGPMVVIAGSGMATGGRIVHHLHEWADDPRNLIVLAGFQAGGTRGALIRDGAKTVRIFGDDVPIAAEVVTLDTLSAHADADEILAWARRMPKPPRETFVNHGEPSASDTLRARIKRELGWQVRVPDHMAGFDLAPGKSPARR